MRSQERNHSAQDGFLSCFAVLTSSRFSCLWLGASGWHDNDVYDFLLRCIDPGSEERVVLDRLPAHRSRGQAFRYRLACLGGADRLARRVPYRVAYGALLPMVEPHLAPMTTRRRRINDMPLGCASTLTGVLEFVRMTPLGTTK
jgi:hypothetical protein